MRPVKFRSTLACSLAALLLFAGATGPTAELAGRLAVGIEQAQAQKPSSGSTSLKSSGDKGADLLSAIVGPASDHWDRRPQPRCAAAAQRGDGPRRGGDRNSRRTADLRPGHRRGIDERPLRLGLLGTHG